MTKEEFTKLVLDNVATSPKSWREGQAVFNVIDDLVGQSLQQEQSEVDLDKFAEKIDAYKARYKYPESVSVKGAMAYMARMFYQYPNAARQWYEQLPKATMD